MSHGENSFKRIVWGLIYGVVIDGVPSFRQGVLTMAHMRSRNAVFR